MGTDLCIVGGGPAGMVAGPLFARPFTAGLAATPVLCWRWLVDAPSAKGDMTRKAAKIMRLGCTSRSARRPPGRSSSRLHPTPTT